MSDKTDDRKKISPKAATLEALEYCHNTGQPGTRTRIAFFAGCSQALVDDALKFLVMEEKITRVARGCYSPIQSLFESRAVSITMLNTGAIKVEVGDTLLQLTMLEARHLGTGLLGVAINAKEIFARLLIFPQCQSQRRSQIGMRLRLNIGLEPGLTAIWPMNSKSLKRQFGKRQRMKIGLKI